MFDLKDLITKYPECMDNRTKFCSYIYDLYPETSKAFVGVLGDILDCGIAKELKDAGGVLDPLTMASYQARLNATKVYSTKAVIEGIKLWAQAFREETEAQSSEGTKAPKTNSKHVHKYTSTLVSSNCQEHGYTRYLCKCGFEVKKDFLPLGEHSYKEIDRTNPTCVSSGKIEYLCSVCNEYKEDILPIVKHVFSKWKTVQNPSCTQDGKASRSCTVCGLTETKSVKAAGHSFGDWSEDTPATCTKSGTQVRICSKCGTTEEEEVPATGHKYDTWRPLKEKNRWETYCKNCGCTLSGWGRTALEAEILSITLGKNDSNRVFSASDYPIIYLGNLFKRFGVEDIDLPQS